MIEDYLLDHINRKNKKILMKTSFISRLCIFCPWRIINGLNSSIQLFGFEIFCGGIVDRLQMLLLSPPDTCLLTFILYRTLLLLVLS
jgi:hypothetical protein